MRLLRSTWSLRSIVFGLLLSMLPMLVLPLMREGHSSSIDRYSDWLRGQFHQDASETVEYAIARARSQDAADLSAFLAAFIEAYNSFSGVGDFAVSQHSFWSAFQFEFLQLVSNAIAPSWIIKSVQARTLLSQERVKPGLQAIVQASKLTAFQEQVATAYLPILSSRLVSLSPISPRAP